MSLFWTMNICHSNEQKLVIGREAGRKLMWTWTYIISVKSCQASSSVKMAHKCEAASWVIETARDSDVQHPPTQQISLPCITEIQKKEPPTIFYKLLIYNFYVPIILIYDTWLWYHPGFIWVFEKYWGTTAQIIASRHLTRNIFLMRDEYENIFTASMRIIHYQVQGKFGIATNTGR